MAKIGSVVLLLVWVSLFFPGAAFGAASDPALRWKTIDTGHFSIHFHEGEEEAARRLQVITEEVYDSLSKKFDARPWGRTEVVLTDDHDQANGFTLVVPYNLIILRVVPPAADHSLADYDLWLKELFAHEYTHVLHLSDTRYPAKFLKFFMGKLMAPNGLSPGWVTEGIATYFESAETSRGRGRSSFTDMMLRTDILRGKFLHLDQMAGNQYEWPAWMSQYLYGVGFWNYLADTYGEDKVTEFSHKYGASLWFFALNNKARKVFKDEEGRGKSFHRLWQDWKASLEGRTTKIREEVTREGVREGEVFLSPSEGESRSLPTFSPDGKNLAYVAASPHFPTRLKLRDLETGKERVLLKKRDLQQLSFSPDGKILVTSNIGAHKRYYHPSDLHEVTLETGKVRQITKGKRARDPDFSPDGKKIAAVLQETGRALLGLYDRETKAWETVMTGDGLDHPRWLPDGRSVVVSAHRKGQRDLWIVDTKTGRERRITNDTALEDRPSVDLKSKTVYFSSDRTGIPNIYKYDLKTGRTSRVTNVLTGAFAPSVDSQGAVVYQQYTGKGFEIRRLETGGAGGAVLAASAGPPTSLSFKRAEDSRRLPAFEEGAGDRTAPPAPPVLAKDYHPFRRLFIPRYLFPNAALIDGSVFLSATTGNFDPLHRHEWYGDATFRSDNRFVGFDVGYTYNRFLMPLSFGFSNFSVNYGDVSGSGSDFFEERRRGFSGVSLPLGGHRFNLSYFLENRSHESGILAAGFQPTLGNYAGFFARYSVGKTEGTAARISPEEGGRFNLNFEMTNSLFGSAETLEQEVVWADARTFFRVPGTRHHVLAFRGAGGAAFGDPLLQGNFGLGGSIGEGPFTGTSTRVFTLRGLPLVTFSRDRAWVASAEYRMPLFRVQRGWGTLPFFMNSAHLALFADVGDAFRRGNPSFRPLLGVGGELRGDFVLGYSLPIMGRLGYGVILTHRERLAGLGDPLTGMDVKNGIVILEVGTSF